jgi:hypothetical protein
VDYSDSHKDRMLLTAIGDRGSNPLSKPAYNWADARITTQPGHHPQLGTELEEARHGR